MKKPNLDKKRVLVIRGFVAPEEHKLLKGGLPETLPDNSYIVFTDYALAEFPIGEKFMKIFSNGNLDTWAEIDCEIVAVTQQFAKPFDVVPAGWKTICVFHVKPPLPNLWKALPTGIHREWGSPDLSTRLCLCDDDTWQQLLDS